MTDEPTAQAAPQASPQPIDKLAGALAKAQAVITSPPRNREVTVKLKDNKGQYKFKYATLDSIIDHVRKALTDNGLWFSQTLDGNGEGKYHLVTTLLHESGQSIHSTTPLLVSGGGNQEFGSALSYMRRYSLCSILGVAADEDDDANTADGNDVARVKYETKDDLWAGPLPKMKFKAAMSDFCKELDACGDSDQLLAFLNMKDSQILIDQCIQDKPSWYYGTGDSDVLGLEERINSRKAALTEPKEQVA
ncbi:MAG: ERF family protein [Candidatus Brocadiales bacterium]|nr:ERF family protein [Candidatus Bathyanammoxibius sp.]